MIKKEEIKETLFINKKMIKWGGEYIIRNIKKEEKYVIEYEKIKSDITNENKKYYRIK